MRTWSIIALVLALIAIAISAYGRFQVFPDFQDASLGASHADSGAVDIVEDLRSTLNWLAYPSLGLGGLAIIFGVMSFIWGRHPIGIVAAVLGLGAVGLALMSRPTVQLDPKGSKASIELRTEKALARVDDARVGMRYDHVS